jgi:hypothetical protein
MLEFKRKSLQGLLTLHNPRDAIIHITSVSNLMKISRLLQRNQVLMKPGKCWDLFTTKKVIKIVACAILPFKRLGPFQIIGTKQYLTARIK